MIFTIVQKRPGGDTGKISIGLAGEATEIWTLQADGYNYTTEDCRASGVFPSVYESFHQQNSRLRLMPIEIKKDEENPSKFEATLTWTSDKLDPKKEDEKEDSPLNRKARVRVKTSKMRETRHRDFTGKPKVNKCLDLFDPPIENNVSFKVITIRKNVTQFPDWVFDYDDAVNSVPFTIKGRVIDTGCAWIADIDLGEENTDGPIPYAEAIIEMHVRKRRKPEDGEVAADIPDPWDTEQLNEGMYCYKDVDAVRKKVRCTVYDDSDPPVLVPSPGPMPLADDGTQLPLNSAIGDLTFLVFRDHEYLDFNAISYLWSDA